tara:strand:- start:38582 stop:39022 length:441 start_codon:yes stop_codon:yes gene_type:complete
LHRPRSIDRLTIDRFHLRRVAILRDDQRRSRLVDQDGIRFVDDCKTQPAHHHLLAARTLMQQPLQRHVQGPGFGLQYQTVLQVIEGELLVGTIGDVAGIYVSTRIDVHIFKDHADAQTEKLKQRGHPFGVTRGKEIIHRHYMHRNT